MLMKYSETKQTEGFVSIGLLLHVDKKKNVQSIRRTVELTAWIMNMSYVAALNHETRSNMSARRYVL